MGVQQDCTESSHHASINSLCGCLTTDEVLSVNTPVILPEPYGQPDQRAEAIFDLVENLSLAWEEQPGVLDGSLDAVLGFLDGFVWKAYNIHAWQPIAGINFHLDDDAFQTDYRAGVDTSQH